MTPRLENLQVAYDLVVESLRQAPQLYDCHLDQALLVLILAMKRARRSPKPLSLPTGLSRALLVLNPDPSNAAKHDSPLRP